jgi:hypothetical protein
MNLRIFGWSYAVTAASLVVALLYGGWEALILCAVLGILEVSLSFDNAVVNATVLERMSEFWQKIFLTIGILIAVFGMRLVFPLLIVGITADLDPVEAVTEREHTWLSWVERPLARIGQLNRISVVIAIVALVLLATFLADEPTVVLIAGSLGLITYLAVNGLGDFFEQAGQRQLEAFEEEDAAGSRNGSGPSQLARATGKAGFFLFLYLEVLDAAFSFDGVIGAFAITTDPIIIALGLGLIGAMFVRSLTVFLVRKGTLADYVYLEHGAHWAIGALAAILLVGIGYHVNEVVTGLVGVAFILSALASSILRNRRLAAQGVETRKTADELAADHTSV